MERGIKKPFFDKILLNTKLQEIGQVTTPTHRIEEKKIIQQDAIKD